MPRCCLILWLWRWKGLLVNTWIFQYLIVLHIVNQFLNAFRLVTFSRSLVTELGAYPTKLFSSYFFHFLLLSLAISYSMHFFPLLQTLKLNSIKIGRQRKANSGSVFVQVSDVTSFTWRAATPSTPSGRPSSRTGFLSQWKLAITISILMQRHEQLKHTFSYTLFAAQWIVTTFLRFHLNDSILKQFFVFGRVIRI